MYRAHFCFYRNIGQTGKRQPRLFDMGTDPQKVNLLTVNWQLFLRTNQEMGTVEIIQT